MDLDAIQLHSFTNIKLRCPFLFGPHYRQLIQPNAIWLETPIPARHTNTPYAVLKSPSGAFCFNKVGKDSETYPSGGSQAIGR